MGERMWVRCRAGTHPKKGDVHVGQGKRGAGPIEQAAPHRLCAVIERGAGARMLTVADGWQHFLARETALAFLAAVATLCAWLP